MQRFLVIYNKIKTKILDPNSENPAELIACTWSDIFQVFILFLRKLEFYLR